MTRWSPTPATKESRNGRTSPRAGPVRHPEWRIAARKGALRAMPNRTGPSPLPRPVCAQVEHPFLIVKRDFGFTKTRYRGLAKNLNHLNMLFASSANWLMRPCPRPDRVRAGAANLPETGHEAPNQGATGGLRPRPSASPRRPLPPQKLPDQRFPKHGNCWRIGWLVLREPATFADSRQAAL